MDSSRCTIPFFHTYKDQYRILAVWDQSHKYHHWNKEVSTKVELHKFDPQDNSHQDWFLSLQVWIHIFLVQLYQLFFHMNWKYIFANCWLRLYSCLQLRYSWPISQVIKAKVTFKTTNLSTFSVLWTLFFILTRTKIQNFKANSLDTVELTLLEDP